MIRLMAIIHLLYNKIISMIMRIDGSRGVSGMKASKGSLH